MLLFVTFIQFAWSIEGDGDGDGYPAPPHLPPVDCDDTLASVSPKAPEVIGNARDEDCDGTDALNRRVILDRFGSDWAYLGGATHSGVATGKSWGDTLLIEPSSQASKSMSVSGTHGPVVLALDVEHSGFTCEVAVTANPPGLGPTTITRSISSSGTLVIPFDGLPNPPRVITKVKLSCPLFSELEVDWITVQNAAGAQFPPSADVAVTWEDMNASGMGQSWGITRVAEDDYLLTGSDAAGVGIKDLYDPDDPMSTQPWRAANGVGASGLLMPFVWDVAGVQWDDAPAKPGDLRPRGGTRRSREHRNGRGALAVRRCRGHLGARRRQSARRGGDGGRRERVRGHAAGR